MISTADDLRQRLDAASILVLEPLVSLDTSHAQPGWYRLYVENHRMYHATALRQLSTLILGKIDKIVQFAALPLNDHRPVALERSGNVVLRTSMSRPETLIWRVEVLFRCDGTLSPQPPTAPAS